MTFPFDIGDPREMAAHLKELRDALTAKLREREQLSEDIEQLQNLIQIGEGVSRRATRPAAQMSRPRRRRAAPAQDRAVQALEQASKALAGTAVGPTSLHRYMLEHGLDAPEDATALGTNLWDAWKAGRIRRAPNGVYLPLDNTGRTEVDYPLTDYYYARERGLPVPPATPRPRRARDRF